MTTSRYLVRAAGVHSYQPANHEHTFNQRLIGPETVGARQMEVLLGTLHKGGGALPHAHPGIEQACYLLEGTARAEVDGEATWKSHLGGDAAEVYGTEAKRH